LDWENEPYVRLYTRDTAAWVALPFQARCVFNELKRKVDRAGVLKLGRRGLAALPEFLRMPAEFVHVGINALLEEGTVREGEERIVIPDHLESEEAERSDKARQRDSRERRLARALANGATIEQARAAARPDRYCPPAVGHSGSHGVAEDPEGGGAPPAPAVAAATAEATECAPSAETTETVGVGHTGSHGVTEGHSLLCLALPSLLERSVRSPPQEPPPPPPPAAAPPARRVRPPPHQDAIDLAEQLRGAILAVKPNARCGNPKAWASSRDPWARKLAPLLRERDRAALERAIAFYPTQAGGPYSLVIESADAFVEKLDRLELAMARAAPPPRPNGERYHAVRDRNDYPDPVREMKEF